MSSANRWIVCGGDAEKDVRSICWMKVRIERSWGGSAPSGVVQELG